jgi:7-carboxy-7-deazaguanine synthase
MEHDLYVHEIFPSFQGEGILLGAAQVFVRLSGCNLHCSYCDTLEAREKSETCRVYGWEGEREEAENPMDTKTAEHWISSVWDRTMHSVSLTGGEPLLQAEALALLLPLLRQKHVGIYLETNGTLHEELDLVLPWIDWIAMDVKLPSSQGGRDFIEEQRVFLRRSIERDVFLKMVIDVHTGNDEVRRFCSELGEVPGDRTLVLQPATPQRGEEGITAGRAHELYRIASSFFPDVRVIPQAHRSWGVK